jgi:hypothetical protein
MSTNDTLAQTPPLSQFDLAIMNALKKNPKGLRYSELHRKSELEYERMGSGKGINVRTFDKHLKWLVSERALERIVEARYRVYYKLTIPTQLKVYVEASRAPTMSIVKTLEKCAAERSQFPEPLVGLLMDWIGYSVKDALLMGFQLWTLKNPVFARYWVDEEMETTRHFFNEIAHIFARAENIEDLYRLFKRLDDKWGEQFRPDMELLR